MFEPLIGLNEGEGTQTGPTTGAVTGTIAGASDAVSTNTPSTVVKRGASGEIAVGAMNGMTFRKIASGSTACNTAATTDLGTFTRQAGETVKLFSFVQENNLLPVWFEGSDNSSGVWHYYRRTTNANEFTVRVGNVSTVNIVLDWVLVGITP